MSIIAVCGKDKICLVIVNISLPFNNHTCVLCISL